MADIIIITIIAIAVFFIIRGELKKLRRGRCGGGCSSCNGSCNGCVGTPVQKKEHI